MEDISLATWANLAEIVGAGSIITGLVFGWFQVRVYRAQQRDIVAINLVETFYNDSLARALTLLQPLPDGLGIEELQRYGDEHVNAAITVTTSFETMGLLVYKRIATMELVLDLAGGIIITMNRKLNVWQNEVRQAQSQPSWGEWFEWLADQALRLKETNEPAHIAFRNWKP